MAKIDETESPPKGGEEKEMAKVDETESPPKGGEKKETAKTDGIEGPPKGGEEKKTAKVDGIESLPKGGEKKETAKTDGIEGPPKGKEIPDFGPGDKVRVRVKFKEGEQARKQKFEGVVISRRGNGMGETFTVRKLAGRLGVERIFPLHSPCIEELQVMKRGKVRRAKLYYLRNKK